jgi:hypothetical protein
MDVGMSDVVERYRKGNRIVDIYYDMGSDSPREWSNMGRMIISKSAPLSPSPHANAVVGSGQNRDKSVDMDYYENDGWKGLRKSLVEQGAAVILPVHMHDYGSGGMRVHTAAKDDFESGMAGFIYVTKEDLKKEGMSAAQAEKNLEAEIAAYNQWVNGDVFGYEVYDISKCGACAQTERKDVDSVWGFYGIEDVEENAGEAAGFDLKKAEKIENASHMPEVLPTKSTKKSGLNLGKAKLPSQNPSGWHREPINHALASKGIKVGKSREKR